MADESPTISSLNQLPLTTPQKRALDSILGNPQSSAQDILGFLADVRVTQPNINISALQQQISNRISLVNQTQADTQQTPTPSSNIQDGTNFVSAALLAGLTGDSSRGTEILHNLNQEQEEKFFEKNGLADVIQKAIESGNEQEARRLIEVSLDSEKLFSERVTLLKGHVKEARGNVQTIETKYKEVQEKKNKPDPNPRREKRRQQAIKEKEAFDKKRIDLLLQALRSSGKKKVTAERKKQLLHQYIVEQQARNSDHIFHMLSKRGFLNMRTSSVFSKETRNVLAKRPTRLPKKALPPKSPEQTKHTQRQYDEEEREKAPKEEYFNKDTGAWEEPAQIQEHTVFQVPQGSFLRRFLPSPTAIPKVPVASGVRTIAFFATPEGWITIGLIILLIVLIIIIILLASGPGCGLSCPVPLTQISCGNVNYPPRVGPDYGKQVIKATKDYFLVNFEDDTTVGKDGRRLFSGTDASVAKALYGTSCILSGESSPGSTKADFNNFWWGVIGYNQSTNGYTPPTIHLMQDKTATDSANRITCASNYGVSFDQHGPPTYYLYNPDACTSQAGSQDNPVSFATPKLQFVVSKLLATIFLNNNISTFNPVFFKGTTADMVKEFTTNATLFHGINALPSYSCASSVGTPKFVNNCFTDMVGEYITFPWYLDTAGQDGTITPPPVKPPTPTPPGYSLATNLIFSNYPSDPAYSLYYNFARDNLFNGQSFFLAPQSSCSTPPAGSVVEIQSILKSRYGVDLLGDSGKNGLNLQSAQSTYETVCLLAEAPLMKTNLFGGAQAKPLGIFWGPENRAWCGNGAAKPATDTSNLCETKSGIKEDCVHLGWSGEQALCRMNTGHELGHVFNWRRPDIFKNFCQKVFGQNLGSGGVGWECGGPSIKQPAHAIPTYSCNFDYGRGPFGSECWADMIGEYLAYDAVRMLSWIPKGNYTYTTTTGGPTSYALSDTFQEYKTKFPDYYNFAKNAIFGGVEYLFNPPKVAAENPKSIGFGNCSPDKMAPYFADQANNASCICAQESQSVVNAIKNTCGQSLPKGQEQEYSVGLFQINLTKYPDYMPDVCKQFISSQDTTCTVNDAAMRNCLEQNGKLTLDANVTYAANLFKSVGNRWSPTWSTAGACGLK